MNLGPASAGIIVFSFVTAVAIYWYTKEELHARPEEARKKEDDIERNPKTADSDSGEKVDIRTRR